MFLSLITLSFLMGLSGGPHCLMMCGPACSLLSKHKTANFKLKPSLLFLTGRTVGYGALGALAAMSMKTLGWLSTQSTLFRPLWNLTHVLAMVLGLFLLILASQPLWLGEMAKSIWSSIERYVALRPIFKKPWALFVMGVFWSFLPCGLLYSVLMLAALSANAVSGAWVMISFSIGGALFMWVGSEVFARLSAGKKQTSAPNAHMESQPIRFKTDPTPASKPKAPIYNEIGVRLAGMALVVNSAWILYHDLVLNQAPWCLPTP